jgi:hypothetical protein
MAELGASQYIGQLTALVSPATSAGTVSPSRGLHYTRLSSGSVDEGDYGTSYSLTVRPTVPLPAIVSQRLITYRMRGRDVDCATLTYRYWYSVGAPDLSASLYTGPKCGVSALADVTVLDNVAS